jgi:hypothetical protein
MADSRGGIVLRRFAAIWLVLASAVLVSASLAAAGSTRGQHSTVRLFMQPTAVSGASAHLTRGSAGISFTLHTFLPAGDADTVWWVIFNNPSACTDSAGPGLSCGLGDVDPSSPADVSVLNADGLVVGTDGVANFQGSLTVGGTGPGEVLFGSGITNPLGAEIHLLVEDHGVASSDPATLYLQTHNDGGGCCPPNSCTLVQDATFPIP